MTLIVVSLRSDNPFHFIWTVANEQYSASFCCIAISGRDCWMRGPVNKGKRVAGPSYSFEEMDRMAQERILFSFL